MRWSGVLLVLTWFGWRRGEGARIAPRPERSQSRAFIHSHHLEELENRSDEELNLEGSSSHYSRELVETGEKLDAVLFSNEMFPTMLRGAPNANLTMAEDYSLLEESPRPPVPPNPREKSPPLLPFVLQVSALRTSSPKPLPQDIQTLMDNAKDGVIYFSMGSLLRGSTLPDNKRNAFVKTFAKLNQTVLWKWEDDQLPGKPPNVHTFKWISQRDVLEHPNVVLYIAHGGLFGLSEAVHCGIPIVGIPIFGDQPYNVQNIVDMGAAVKLDYSTISEETVSNAIHTVLSDSRYRENAKLLSARYRDRQNSALETAVYWTEYVIRHKGARHLRSAAVELTWYQYLLLDVLSFIALFLLFFIIMMYLLVKIIYSMIVSKWKRKPRKAKKH